MRKVFRTVASLGPRLAHDYGRADHIESYRDVLQRALRKGYRVGSMLDLAEMRGSPPADPWLILRHDVDVAPSVAERMLEVEQEVDVTSTFYFRITTASGPAFDKIVRSSADIGYHYEELATVAKLLGTRSPQDASELIPMARELTALNIRSFADRCDRHIRHVSSHGDFANTIIGITNTAIFDDAFRQRTNVEFEAYDEAINRPVSTRVADQPDAMASVERVLAAVEAESPVVYYLTHPRWWASSRTEALTEDLYRVTDAIKFKRGSGNRRIANQSVHVGGKH